MSWPRVFASKILALFRKHRLERELDDEVRFHAEMQMADNIRAGMSPEEARYAAMRSFGGVEQMKEEFREQRSLSYIETFVRDLRQAARSFLRQPGFTIAACLSLALGIGVTTAIFTVLNAVALRPLPYPDAERLIWMTQILKKNSTDEVTITSHFLEWRMQNHAFTDLAGYNYQTRNLTGVEQPMQLRTAKASASLLPILGVEPAMGRNFTKQEDYKGRDQVALLAASFWRQQFGADPNIIGRRILLDAVPFTIIGVLPADFEFPGPDAVQLMTPLGKDEVAELQNKVGSIIFNTIGRLKPGVTLEQACADLTVIQAGLPIPPFRPTISLKMQTLRTHLFGNVKTASLVLVAAAGFLLLIACANLSNLLLARWMQRDRELAIRSALGGSRARLIGQLLTESALLGVLACAAGIALAFWARRPLFLLSPYEISGLRNLPFDWRVLAFAVALGLTTTLIFGLIPALRATKVQLAEAMKVGEAAVVGGRGSLRILSFIAAGEIATTLILSAGAGLMLQSFWKLRYVNLGFQPDHLIVGTLNLSGPAYREKARQSAFLQDLLQRAQNLPGVETAALTRAGEIPPGDFHATNSFAIEGRNQPLGGVRPIARHSAVSPAFFAMLGIPLLQGRLFADSDGETAAPVVMVNRALIRRYFENEDPLGKRIRVGGDDQAWRTIAGVVGDVKTSGLSFAAEPTLYLPYRQEGSFTEIGVVMRSSLNADIIAAEFRKTVTSLDANLPVASVQSMDDRLSKSVSGPRFTTILLIAFAALAVVLGLIGVYGVMGCHIRWQLRELAVRQALGAQQKDVVMQVLRHGFTIILPGLITGLLGALALSKTLASMLHEVSPHDPLTLATVSLSLVCVAFLACWIPAMRAAHTDPLQLLRHD